MNQSRYFHVTEGLVPDVMHDVLEGIFPLEIKELIKQLIKDGIITLSKLNEAIETFPYGRTDSQNKPLQIAHTTLTSSDHSLKQTGG